MYAIVVIVFVLHRTRSTPCRYHNPMVYWIVVSEGKFEWLTFRSQNAHDNRHSASGKKERVIRQERKAWLILILINCLIDLEKSTAWSDETTFSSFDQSQQ